MLELLQTSVEVVPEEPALSWLSEWDGEVKWVAIAAGMRYAHDVLKDYVAAWRDVENTRTRDGN